jgi:broad specificity phosphatase PhoE
LNQLLLLEAIYDVNLILSAISCIYFVMRELYIIRHGQTDYNAKGIVQGKGVNQPLNSLGRMQAAAFYEAYKHIAFDALFSSSLLRAQQTIAPFASGDIPHQSMSELDEISWGEWEGDMTTHETDKAFFDLTESWKRGETNKKVMGGESPEDLRQRQLKFLAYLETTSYQRVLIATHGRFIRAFMCTLAGVPLSEMENFNHVNLCLYIARKNNSGSFDIITRCETAHLNQLA